MQINTTPQFSHYRGNSHGLSNENGTTVFRFNADNKADLTQSWEIAKTTYGGSHVSAIKPDESGVFFDILDIKGEGARKAHPTQPAKNSLPNWVDEEQVVHIKDAIATKLGLPTNIEMRKKK